MKTIEVAADRGTGVARRAGRPLLGVRPQIATNRAVSQEEAPLPVIKIKQKAAVKPTVQLDLFPVHENQCESVSVQTPRRIHLGAGLYQDTATGALYERPWINGRRTMRALGTTNERAARNEMARRRAAALASLSGAVESPYQRRRAQFIEEILAGYLKAGTPNRQRRPRPEPTAKAERRNCQILIQILGPKNINDLTPSLLDAYADKRMTAIASVPSVSVRARPRTGRRSVDLELNTLSNAFSWAVRSELIRQNPLAQIRVKYCTEPDITHCRESRPEDAAELHQIVAWIFQARGHRSEVAGWQYLIEAMTGLRTIEALRLRTDARRGEPGYIERCPKTQAMLTLHVRRAKAGINPFVIIYPELETALNALFSWKSPRYPKSKYYFPSFKKEGAALSGTALAHVLRKAGEKFGKRLTSHGARSFYVTVRRSAGINDAQIAVELGQSSGPALICRVYGDVPANWRAGTAPKMPWLPEGKPAWSALKQAAANIIRLPKENAA